MISIDGLNSLFRGKATWLVERSELERSSIVSFRCDKQTPVMRINERVFEDAMDPSMPHGELNDYEFCERQSVLRAERAMKSKR